MIYIKVHQNPTGKILAVCDKELIGKTFEDSKLCLNVSERFYKGELVDDVKLIKLVKAYDNINIVGKNSINLFLKEKIITKDHVIKIKNIPHAQIIKC